MSVCDPGDSDPWRAAGPHSGTCGAALLVGGHEGELGYAAMAHVAAFGELGEYIRAWTAWCSAAAGRSSLREWYSTGTVAIAMAMMAKGRSAESTT